MSLRLTLRTLLAYLDDTLEPSQARAIGQKVAESESARELIERIKQVTRRRRLTTPPASGPGGSIDPNTVADYLDNEVTPEQAAEVEQICLSSDVHLAEVAACHQILTLILGEPVKPPASASQRMYGLVKGRGVIATRKPVGATAQSGPEPHSESREIDETLRLGLPPLGRKDGWRNPLILIGGGFLAAILLVVAVFQILHLTGNRDVEPKTNGVAQANGTKDKSETEKPESTRGYKGVRRIETDKKDSDVVATKKTDDETESKKTAEITKKGPGADTQPASEEVAVPFGPPNPRQMPIGHYSSEAKESSILLQSPPDGKIEWKRLTPKQNEVYSARPLLSLPGSRSVVQTTRGVRVTLWGTMPEFVVAPPVFESLVELYADEVLDLDLKLERGRVVLTSTRPDKPVRVRLRFENPLAVGVKDSSERQEFFDITLPMQGASILVDRWSGYPPTEPFFKDPRNPKRVGPTADMACVVLEGTLLVKTGDSTYTMTAPRGPGLLLWNSLAAVAQLHQLPKLPDFVLDEPPLPPGLDPKVRKDMAKKCEYLSKQLTSNVDVGLYQQLYSPDPATRRLVVRSLAAVSDLPNLLEALEQPKFADVRSTAIDALRHWAAASRDNDYMLFGLLKEKYKGREAEIIMDLMHGFSETERRRPETYELLIGYLTNPNLIIRELGAWNLYKLVPAGKVIPYSAAADSQARERAVISWHALVPPGQLPASVTPAQKKKS